MRNFSSRKIRVLTAVAAVVAMAGAAVVIAVSGGDADSNSPAAKPPVPTAAPAPAPIPTAATEAHAAPKQRPRVDVGADCEKVLTPIRAVMDEYKSGLALNSDGTAELATALGPLNAGDGCSPADAAKFRTDELTPWLSYSVTK